MNQVEKLYTIYQSGADICTDSRKITKGCIFFALKGESFNGNAFAVSALQNGAGIAVIDESSYDKGKEYLLVDDVLVSLQQLALYHRRKLNIPIIAITGSNGKTTTKELVSAVLATTYRTAYTQGNLNNHIGLPLTLLSVTAGHEMAVIEMGANHRNEIALLCSIAEPTHGLITNIGKAHLEGFGGLEGVKKGKGELYEHLKEHKGFIFINPDQPALVELLENYPAFKSYGLREDYDISGAAGGNGTFMELSWRKKQSKDAYRVKTQLTGNYNLPNVLAAACIGDHFKIPAQKICSAIEGYIPGNQRSQVVRRGSNTIILDAYNANPSSMEVALYNFNENYPGDKIAVIGDMLELGDDGDREHQSILELIAKMDFREVVVVGKNYGKYAGKLKGHFFDNSEEAKEWISKAGFSNAAILIKGSRGLKMEKTLEAF
jgi:UDP-N-acetylmuramoyl-tripeptide--D-alanyl-D-alanine ligase